MSAPITHFHFCPRCGQPVQGEAASKSLQCGHCSFLYFFNPTISAVGFVFDTTGKILVIRRGREPSKGMLGFPGGFIDAGESAEVALEREVMEETGLKIEGIQYLGGFPNSYPYAGVTYPVLDLFFRASTPGGTARPQAGEIESISWMRPQDLDPTALAFASLQRAWARFSPQ